MEGRGNPIPRQRDVQVSGPSQALEARMLAGPVILYFADGSRRDAAGATSYCACTYWRMRRNESRSRSGRATGPDRSRP
jgi:hypothetical protein